MKLSIQKDQKEKNAKSYLIDNERIFYTNTFIFAYPKNIIYLSSEIYLNGLKFRIVVLKKTNYPFVNNCDNMEIVILDANNNNHIDDWMYTQTMFDRPLISALYGIIGEPQRTKLTILEKFGINVVKVFREFVRIKELRPIDAACHYFDLLMVLDRLNKYYAEHPERDPKRFEKILNLYKYDFVWTWNLGESDKDYDRWLTDYVLRHYVGLDNDVIRELKKRG